jgi:NADH-quinone oxidoreductase subunit H
MLCAGVHAGGFRWTKILAAQNANPFSWTLFSSPFEPLAFLVFVIAGLVLFSSSPMDSASGRPETEGGISSVWAGRNLSLVNFGRFYGFFLWSCMAATLFLGGWLIPQSLQSLLDGGVLQTVLEVTTLLLKSFLIMLAVTAVAKIYPRTRTDQITGLLWRVISPLALFSLIGSALWGGWLS